MSGASRAAVDTVLRRGAVVPASIASEARHNSGSLSASIAATSAVAATTPGDVFATVAEEQPPAMSAAALWQAALSLAPSPALLLLLLLLLAVSAAVLRDYLSVEVAYCVGYLDPGRTR